jgi:hypothetical protein
MNEERNTQARARLIEAVRRGTAFALTGAGASVWAGYGTWTAVIDHLAAAAQQYAPGLDAQAVIQNNLNPLHRAQHLGVYLGPRFREFIRAEFGPNGVAPHDVLYRLCSLPFRHFLTFNFDPSLEAIHATMPRRCASTTTGNLHHLIDFMRTRNVDGVDRQVLHLHGSYDDSPDSIALTNDGYARLYAEGSLFRRLIFWLVISQCLVFIGFGFTDSDFTNTFRVAAFELREYEPVHFAIRGIWPNENDEAIRNDMRDTYKIEPVFYLIAGTQEDQDHTGFVELIGGIGAELGLPAQVRPLIELAQVEHGASVAEPEDIRRAEQIGNELIERLAPGDGDVPN